MSANNGQVMAHHNALVIAILRQRDAQLLHRLFGKTARIMFVIFQIAELDLLRVPFQHRSSSHSIATIPEAGYNRSMRSLTEKGLGILLNIPVLHYRNKFSLTSHLP